MDANGVFSVAAIFVAIYSFLPERWRADLYVRCPRWVWVVVAAPFLCAAFVVLSPVLVGLSDYHVPWFFGFNEETLLFLYMLLAVLVFCWALLWKGFSDKCSERLYCRVELMLSQGLFSDALYLVALYRGHLFREGACDRYKALVDRCARAEGFLEFVLKHSPDFGAQLFLRVGSEISSDIFLRALLRRADGLLYQELYEV